MRRTKFYRLIAAIGFMSISCTALLADEGDADHDPSADTAGETKKTAETAKPKGETTGTAADAKAEDRKLAQERIRAELTDVNDTTLIRFWNGITNVEKLSLEKFKEVVKGLPPFNADKKKDEDKRASLISVFENAAILLSESPLKDFQKVSAEVVFERFGKKKDGTTVTEGTDKKGGDDKKGAAGAGKSDAEKAAEAKLQATIDEIKKLNGQGDKKAPELSKQEAAKLAEAAKADQNKQLGDALKNALASAGQDQGGGQGQGQGSGGSGDSASKGGSGGGDDSGKDSKTDTPKPPEKTERKKNDASASTSPSTQDKTEAPKKADAKEAKSILPESKVAEKKATPAPESAAVTPTTPEVADAGKPPQSGRGSSRKPGGPQGEGRAGNVIAAGNLPSGKEGPEGQGERDGAIRNPGGNNNANNSNGGSADPNYAKYQERALTSGPTTTGYNMIKTGTGDWQASDGGSANEILGDGYEGGDNSSKRPATLASTSPVGFPSAGGSGRSVSSERSFSSPEGIFKKKQEWQGGEGNLCQGSMKNVIGPCGRRKPGDRTT